MMSHGFVIACLSLCLSPFQFSVPQAPAWPELPLTVSANPMGTSNAPGSWISPHLSPMGRFFHSAAYDARLNRTLVFGGLLGPSLGNAESWSYSVTNNSWARLPATSIAPSGRDRQAMVY